MMVVGNRLKRSGPGIFRLLMIMVFIFVAVVSINVRVANSSEPFFTNSIGQKFVLIPAGTFMMGSPSSEPGRLDNEVQHQVTLSLAFYLQTTEVTQGQWRAVMGNNPSVHTDCGDDCPVDNVSWSDAVEFIVRLNAREGVNKYRLPTEAEWEYAARAGTTTPYHGNDPDAIAWYNENSGVATQQVGQKKANAWGLYDMTRNVWEWCQDWFDDYPASSVTDPAGPPSGTRRVDRGGCWFSKARYCRSAFRLGRSPGYRDYGVGLRLAGTP